MSTMLICPECGSDRIIPVTTATHDRYECQQCGYHSAQVVVKPYREMRRIWKEKYDEQERD